MAYQRWCWQKIADARAALRAIQKPRQLASYVES